MNTLPNYGSESAVAAFMQQAAERVLDEADGVLLGSWHLTFVNHAGHEQDRMVLLTQRTLVRVNADFGKGIVNHATKLPLDCIESVTVGPLVMKSEKARKMSTSIGCAGRGLLLPPMERTAANGDCR